MKVESIQKDSIIKMEKSLLEAMKSCDVQKLDELLHEELRFTIPNGDTITKTIDLETYRSGNMKIVDLKSSNQEINMIDDCAVVSVRIEMKGFYFNFPLDGIYKIIRVWKLLDEQWKVIAGSSIKIDAN